MYNYLKSAIFHTYEVDKKLKLVQKLTPLNFKKIDMFYISNIKGLLLQFTGKRVSSLMVFESSNNQVVPLGAFFIMSINDFAAYSGLKKKVVKKRNRRKKKHT